MHPLVQDLTTLTDEELNKKFEDLNRKYNQAYRSGPYTIIPQIQMLIQDYQAEIARRQAKLIKDMEERASKNGKSFGSIIDIS